MYNNTKLYIKNYIPIEKIKHVHFREKKLRENILHLMCVSDFQMCTRSYAEVMRIFKEL